MLYINEQQLILKACRLANSYNDAQLDVESLYNLNWDWIINISNKNKVLLILYPTSPVCTVLYPQ